MSQNFESALLWRQISSFRFILNPALAAQSLIELFTERLLGPATFGDLSAREARGESPRLIVNTTLYNNGRRLAVTTLPSDTFRYDVSRIPGIMEERATAYTALFYRSMQIEGVFPDHQTLRVIMEKVADFAKNSAAV